MCAMISWAATAAKIEVQGHRGARARVPENTLPAFEHALQAGADVLEMDLGVSRDDQLVVAHDPELNPLLCLDPQGKPVGQGIRLRDLTLAEIQRYDCGTLKNPRFPDQIPIPGTRMPSLDQVFAWVKNHADPRAKTIEFNIETKHPDQNVGAERFAELVIAKLRSSGMLERTVLQSFDFGVLAAAKKIEPALRLSALTHRWNQNSVEIAKQYGVQIISPSLNFINAETVRKLHTLNVRVVPWTANTRKDWARLVKIGVDGIITDDPAALIAYLAEKGQR